MPQRSPLCAQTKRLPEAVILVGKCVWIFSACTGCAGQCWVLLTACIRLSPMRDLLSPADSANNTTACAWASYYVSLAGELTP